MSKLQIFKCLVSQFIKCSGAGEEGDTSIEAKSEEGWHGGGWVEQQDSQGEGQVRGSQGEGWSKVGFSSGVSPCYRCDPSLGLFHQIFHPELRHHFHSILSLLYDLVHHQVHLLQQIINVSIFRKKMLEDRKRAMKEKKAENQDDLVIIM